MSLLFETIRVEDGSIRNLEFHNLRLNKSRNEIYGLTDSIRLGEHIHIPTEYRNGVFKCRVVYNSGIEIISFEQYQKRNIQYIRIIEDNSIEYPYKFTDRNALNNLFSKRGDADEILIVKNGLITDTSFSNIAFFDGQTWFTPASPLLSGTMRSYLLRSQQIISTDIRVIDLSRFEKARLINAMLPLDPGADIEIQNISY